MSENEPATSSSEIPPEPSETVEIGDFPEPECKRRKVSTTKNSDLKAPAKLEHRLGGILCCAVCLDLPKFSVYQCSNGHLMCSACHSHILADARLRDEAATCPNCRVDLGKTCATRNLAVEKAVSELPLECQYCNKEYPRNVLEKHEKYECEERLSGCKYSRIGCPWRGPLHESQQHEIECVHPNRSGGEIMEALKVIDQQFQSERQVFNCLLDLLGYEKITFNDLQLKPYRTDEFVHRLFYESSRFTAFNLQWACKARVNSTQKDPTQSLEREMTYQLILKSKTSTPLPLSFIMIHGPFGDMKVNPKIYKYEFTDSDNESTYMHVPLVNSDECNRLLAGKTINCRKKCIGPCLIKESGLPQKNSKR